MTIEVRGRVMEDLSGRGLGGILVSNGEQIVQTDEEGRYALAVEPGAHRFVFVTVPDGFRATSEFYSSTRNWMQTRKMGWILGLHLHLNGLHGSLRLCRLPIHTL